MKWKRAEASEGLSSVGADNHITGYIKVLVGTKSLIRNNMSKFKFVPQVGMKTNNCYLYGAGDRDGVCQSGHIEHVGVDYFTLRNTESNTPHIITEDSYWCMEETTFTGPPY